MEWKSVRDHLYTIWANIIRRCYNESSSSYKDYGGRGIDVDPDWIYDFDAFYEWAIQNHYRVGQQCDRIDNDSGYYPWNCRFISSKENINNRRNTIFLTVKGEKHPLTFYTDGLGISHSAIFNWIMTRGIEYAEAKLEDITDAGGWKQYKRLSNKTRHQMPNYIKWVSLHKDPTEVDGYEPVTDTTNYNKHEITLGDETKSIAGWARELHLTPSIIRNWIYLYGETKTNDLLMSYRDKSILENQKYLEINGRIKHYSSWARLCDIPSTMVKEWLKEYGTEYTIERIQEYLKRDFFSGQSKFLHCITTDEYFSSYREAEIKLHLSRGSISKMFGKGETTVDDLTFEYLDN